MSTVLPCVEELGPEREMEASPSDGDRSALVAHARRTLTDQLGDSEAEVGTGEACGVVGVQARQTHYSDGFALLMPTDMGTAVALREAETPRVVFAPEGRVWAKGGEGVPEWVEVVLGTVEAVCESNALEVSVASTVLPGCSDGYWASLIVALLRAIRALEVPTVLDTERIDVLRDALVPRLVDEVTQATGEPYGPAHLQATFAGDAPAFTLVDTETREHLPVETDARSALHWAVIDPTGATNGRPHDPALHRRRKEQAEAALARLRTEGFDDLRAFRNLEHRDLERATRMLPPTLRPVVRHLVTENRRVQKHVAALRRSDWQMVGALLLMSHASLRDDWEGATPAASALVSAVETRTHNGLYGACMTERGGAVLVVGRPHVFESGLQHLLRAVEGPAEEEPAVRHL